MGSMVLFLVAAGIVVCAAQWIMCAIERDKARAEKRQLEFQLKELADRYHTALRDQRYLRDQLVQHCDGPPGIQWPAKHKPECIHCCHRPDDCKWGGPGPCKAYCGNPNHRPLAERSQEDSYGGTD